MQGRRSFESVGLILHMPRTEIEYLLPRLDVGSMFSSRETDWKPLHRSTEDIVLAFGRRGLKRVMATRLVPQFFQDGLRLSSCTHEYRATRRAVNGCVEWKESLLFQFDRDEPPQESPTLHRLHSFIAMHCWKRARVLTQRSPDRRFPELAVVELVCPMKLSTQRRCEALEYDGEQGFSSHRIPPLVPGYPRLRP